MVRKTRLILLRHAKSDWHSGVVDDFDRPLAARGYRDAPRIGEWLQTGGILPDVILCSPARRARQTLAEANSRLAAADCAIVYEDDLYGAARQVILDLAEKYSQRCRTVMVVGHNPGLDEVLRYLCGAPPPLTEDGKLMTTAAVAVLELADFGRGKAELLWLTRPGRAGAEPTVHAATGTPE